MALRVRHPGYRVEYGLVQVCARADSHYHVLMFMMFRHGSLPHVFRNAKTLTVDYRNILDFDQNTSGDCSYTMPVVSRLFEIRMDYLDAPFIGAGTLIARHRTASSS
jgi:hypothetical protein